MVVWAIVALDPDEVDIEPTACGRTAAFPLSLAADRLVAREGVAGQGHDVRHADRHAVEVPGPTHSSAAPPSADASGCGDRTARARRAAEHRVVVEDAAADRQVVGEAVDRAALGSRSVRDEETPLPPSPPIAWLPVKLHCEIVSDLDLAVDRAAGGECP